LPGRRTLSRVQLGETIFTRTSVLGRLVTFAAVGGVLAAALVVPVVAATGVLVRNEANKFTAVTLSAQGLPQRSEILDRNGHLLAYVYGVDVPYYNSADSASALQYFGWDRQPVSYSQIAPNMVNALVGIEDSRYWVHGAIDLRGTIRAAVNDLEHKPVQGGSTIAQQYVKNVLLLEAEEAKNLQGEQAAAADTLSRKLNELRMAVNAEHQQSKQDILAGYLNDAYFGNFAYGIETAAETYFGTSAAKLSMTQAATLAGKYHHSVELVQVKYAREDLLIWHKQISNSFMGTPRERGTTWSRLPSFGCSTRPVYWQRLPSRSRMALAHSFGRFLGTLA